MFPNSCVACQQSIRSNRREKIVHALAEKASNPSIYPKVFRLLDRLPLCSGCLNDLPLINNPICHRCGRPLSLSRETHKIDMKKEYTAPSKKICGDCLSHSESSLINRSLLSYTSWGKSLVSRFKYRGDERLANLFADLLGIACLRNFQTTRFDVITYVPLHQSRLEERGFNQSEQLAVLLGRHLEVPVASFLVRSKQTAKLSKQAGRSSRYQSLHEAFMPDDRLELQTFFNRNASLRILLIDDIFTTGATARSCTTAINALPFVCQPEICSLTIFR